MALFINGVGQDTFNMNGVSIDNLYVDGVLVWSSYVNTAPVITILGDNPTYLVLNGSAYIEQGATATDVEGGDITNDIVIGGDTPDVSVEGFYYVTYNVTDSEGLAADEQIRTVEVYAVTVPKYELTEALINDGTFDYVVDSNNPESSFIGKLTESDGTTPYLPTELQYPQNGLLELASGRIMNTGFTQPQAQGGYYGIYDADGSTVYKIFALQPTIGILATIYEGDQDTPLTLTHSNVEIPELGVGPWIITDGRPVWMPSLEDPTNIMNEWYSYLQDAGTGSFNYLADGRDVAISTITTTEYESNPDLRCSFTSNMDSGKLYNLTFDAVINSGTATLTRIDTDVDSTVTISHLITEGANVVAVPDGFSGIYLHISINGMVAFNIEMNNTQIVER